MRHRIVVAMAAIAIVLVGMFSAASSASASTHTDHGCPAGAVCLYTNDPSGAKYVNGQPTYVFFSYGAHNISNAYGIGEWEDNQNGGKGIGSYLCSGSNGTGVVTYNGSRSGPNHPPTYVDAFTDVNFTPVNSVKLVSAGWNPNYGEPC